MKKIKILLVLIILVSCQKEAPIAKEKKHENVKIGYVEGMGIIPLLLASEKGMFQNVKISFEKYEKMEFLNDALLSGEIDGGTVDLVTLMKDNKNSYKSIMQLNQVYDLIVSKDSSLKTLNDVKKNAVGIVDKNKDSFLLDYFNEISKNEESFSTTENNTQETSKKKLDEKSIQSLITNEPYLSAYQTIASSKSLNLLTLSFSNNFINTKKDVLKIIIEAYDNSLLLLANTEDGEKTFPNYFKTGTKYSKENYLKVNNNFDKEIVLINKWLITNSYIGKNILKKDIIDITFIEQKQ